MAVYCYDRYVHEISNKVLPTCCYQHCDVSKFKQPKYPPPYLVAGFHFSFFLPLRVLTVGPLSCQFFL